ncbi:FeoB-associated Cys-rich membrane protein [Gaetbulibacter aquiaggeris]|uniref:FeoB-associated Cys-rich membrane protein n=1 Tax=Gaetbulibacter aquiaggeris TaxID=1735373 RepID=A0ABW7MLF7_9FLAO
MNPFIQNILAIAALILALGFLITKFFLKKKQSKKSCGEEGDCGCH